jgi:hypothetical protein
VAPGATPPVLPALATEQSLAGAEVFTSSLVRALDWAYSTTDSAILSRYFAPGCYVCNRTRQPFDTLERSGGWMSGGHVRLKGLSWTTPPHEDPLRHVIDATVDADSLKLVTASGAVKCSFGARQATLRYDERWISGQWQVVDIAVVQVVPPHNHEACR